MRKLLSTLLTTGLLAAGQADPAPATLPAPGAEEAPRTFAVRGIVREVNAQEKTLVVAHEAIANYMGAMTMPFKVKDPGELAGLQTGTAVSFRLSVTDTRSWIDQLSKAGGTPNQSGAAASERAAGGDLNSPRHPLLSYRFTNELGQAVSLADFRGQALGITFFFTRCPIPEYCPRLSKNFQEASRKLKAQTNAPANWHLLSVTIDPEFDTPPVLRAYGERYHYDSGHWSFLTGPPDKIAEFARLSDVKFERDGGFINHNFRTLIVDSAGRLQTVIPIGGDLADEVTEEILKAASATNASVQTQTVVGAPGAVVPPSPSSPRIMESVSE